MLFEDTSGLDEGVGLNGGPVVGLVYCLLPCDHLNLASWSLVRCAVTSS